MLNVDAGCDSTVMARVGCAGLTPGKWAN